jgi:hypothetical protein
LRTLLATGVDARLKIDTAHMLAAMWLKHSHADNGLLSQTIGALARDLAKVIGVEL